MSHNVGRHRAPGRYNPVAEFGQVVSQAGTPLAKGSAVVAASGGLIAAIAIPAQAANSAPEVDAAPASSVETVATAAVTAPSATSSSTKAVTGFGKIEVEPVAKPTGPTPAQLRARAERERQAEEAAERQREQEQAAAEREQEQAEETQAQEQEPERTESSAPSRSQERQAPAEAETQSAPAPSSSNASGVIAIAKQYIGTPYVYGGSTPSGFDCSGFTQYVFAKAGKSLPRTTTQQQAATTPVSNPQPGDLVFFGSPSYHMGIYLGDGMMIDAPRTGKSVSIRPVFDGVSGYGRV